MNERSFIYEPNSGRIIFGAGSINRLPEEAERLKLERLLVVTTPELKITGFEVMNLLAGRGAAVFGDARIHTPVEVTDAALAMAARCNADGVVALGGGSATGLSKAIALRTDLPQIILPTTYAGSEVTPIIGETRQGLKTTQRTFKVLPEVVIYDVRLSLALPVSISIASGFNAMAHATGALYARNHNPITSLLAEEAIRSLISALPRIAADPRCEDARSDALYGAWLCGTCLGSVEMGLHHKLCHTLGGAFDLPHAETHTVILPHALAYILPAAQPARNVLRRLFEGNDPARALHELGKSLGAPTSLRQLGMPEGEIDRAAELAVQNPYWTPRPIERNAIRALIARAWAGLSPEEGDIEGLS